MMRLNRRGSWTDIKRELKLIAWAIATVSQLGCSAADSIAPLPLDELRAAPSVVRVEGKDLVLSPHLYRDFQPVSPPDGRPLIAGLRILTADSSAVPTSITVDAAWIVYSDQVWAASTADEVRFDYPPRPFYEVFARNGPKWGPDVRVDVIVRVRDSHNASLLLRAANQLIIRPE